jgi:hypothetical protein
LSDLSLALAMTSFRMIAVYGDEGFFAGLDEALAEGLEAWIVFSGGEGGHEEDLLDFGSSAAGWAISFGLAALLGVGGRDLRALRPGGG